MKKKESAQNSSVTHQSLTMFGFLASVLLLVLPFVSFLFLIKANFFSRKSSSVPTFENPRSYPIIGSYFDIKANLTQFNQWSTEIIRNSPTGTYVLHGVFGYRQIMTADPANVQHMLKTQFSLYTKGDTVRAALFDLLGTGIFNADGEQWRFQRQIASHEFNSRSLRNFIENVVKAELSDRLIPVLSTAAADKNSVLDLQDILQRFGFDNVCKIAFGFDPEYLLPSLPTTEFSTAFAVATRISSGRFVSPIPLVWKLKQVLNIGSERKLKLASSTIRQYAKKIIAQKKKEQSSLEATDLLSRFLNYGNLDEELLIDIVISFILAGQDTTSAALTWFFYIISRNSKAEEEILKEINELPDDPGYDEMKDMIYTHSSICESMRLYPPVPSDTKEAVGDDVLPDGTVVKKGMRVSYHPYAMGRMEKLWGKDWMDFKPERWLKKDASTGKLSFNGRDSYTYPVFQAGPRTCLGKDMSFLQMKMLVVGILGRFRIVPAAGDGFEPVYISHLTSKMKDGFPVRIEPRAGF